GDGRVAGVAVGAERAVAVAAGGEEGQAAFDGAVGLGGNHAARGAAVGQGVAAVAAALVGGPSEGGAGHAEGREAAAGPELASRPHDSVSLSATLLRDGPVVLLDEVIVFGHERLRVRVGVHVRPQRLGQVAPDVALIQVGVAVLLAGGVAPAAGFAAGATLR